MPPLPSGGEPRYGNIQEEDHGRGSVIQGATKGPGDVRIVRRDAGGRLPVDSSDDSTREGGGATATVDHPSRGKGPPGIPDVLSGKGGTADILCGRVPGESGDEDGNVGALHAPACPQHRGDVGGRKLPPPTVRLVRHAVPPEGAEQEAPGDRTVTQGNKKEETKAGRDGDEGELGAGV